MVKTSPVSLTNQLRALALACLPQHALSRLTLWATRRHTRLQNPIVRLFIRTYGVNMNEAAEPEPGAYPTFNAFFTRALRADARPIEGDETIAVSPVDGRVSQSGSIEAGQLYQAKGIHYSLTELMGGDRADAERFADGSFATLYLAPGDYHRIHMPLGGQVQHMTHIPGRLYSVAPWTVATVTRLFARNERVATVFDTPHGPLALILVGAINVAAIETVWAGLITPPRGRGVQRTDYGRCGPTLVRGAEMGRFNMGSTVIIVTPPGMPLNATPPAGERVRMGQALGRVATTADDSVGGEMR